MIWKQGLDIRFKSCSNSHIDVVVHGEFGNPPWRATGFYGQPNTNKRYVSWKLMKTLNEQCDMSWFVFGDFNKMTHPEEKLGWLDRDTDQMRAFRECLWQCGLSDLGFVGQRFTWCKERIGTQRTLLRLQCIMKDGGLCFLRPQCIMCQPSHWIIVLLP